MNFLFAFLWLTSLWLFGWICLPMARRVFAALPDGGLACGRLLGLVLISLLAFWLASFHVLPLDFAPLLFALPIAFSVWSLKSIESRRKFFDWVRAEKRALVFSDLVFVAAFFAFAWIRARNPNIVADLEKPMDAALMGSAARAQYLPFDNPWQSGAPFTNYYYFGHLMSALLARAFSTPNYIAYNIAQPAFCAFFISSLWSLCAALTHSRWRGLGATAIVALLGNFEPLRQIIEKHALWPLDWWTTSRVIPNTINEYPAFTLLIGDAHGHFFAFSLATVFFALCFALFPAKPREEAQVEKSEPKKRRKNKAQHTQAASEITPESTPGFRRTFHRSSVLILLGIVLGAITMTNTWDVPLYALLALVCALITLPSRAPQELLWCVLPPVLSRVVAFPFTRLSQPNIGGAQIEFWLPPIGSFLLLWGGILTLILVTARGWTHESWKDKSNATTRFPIAMIAVGLLALLAPFCLYIRGVFGDGNYRHQDTVFKFGLQAWLLLGTAGACGTLLVWSRWNKAAKFVSLAFFVVPILCSACVFHQRTMKAAMRDPNGNVQLSLDATRALPAEDRAAVLWLNAHARNGDTVLEAASDDDWKPFARVSSLTGIATPLGWVPHLRGWGAREEEITRCRTLVQAVWNWPSDAVAVAALKALKVRWIFVGQLEHETYNAATLAQLRKHCGAVYENGDTFIAQVK